MIYGAILGDIIGSVRELHNEKSEEFILFPRESHFTDDSVMTIAIAEAYYREIPEKIMMDGSRYIDVGFRNVINDFMEKYG